MSATAPSSTVAVAPSIARVPIVSVTAVAPSDSETSDLIFPPALIAGSSMVLQTLSAAAKSLVNLVHTKFIRKEKSIPSEAPKI